jgi:hypothetical protein
VLLLLLSVPPLSTSLTDCMESRMSSE